MSGEWWCAYCKERFDRPVPTATFIEARDIHFEQCRVMVSRAFWAHPSVQALNAYLDQFYVWA